MYNSRSTTGQSLRRFAVASALLVALPLVTQVRQALSLGLTPFASPESNFAIAPGLVLPVSAADDGSKKEEDNKGGEEKTTKGAEEKGATGAEGTPGDDEKDPDSERRNVLQQILNSPPGSQVAKKTIEPENLTGGKVLQSTKFGNLELVIPESGVQSLEKGTEGTPGGEGEKDTQTKPQQDGGEEKAKPQQDGGEEKANPQEEQNKGSNKGEEQEGDKATSASGAEQKGSRESTEVIGNNVQDTGPGIQINGVRVENGSNVSIDQDGTVRANPPSQPSQYQPSQYQPSQYQPSQYQPSQYQPSRPSQYQPPSRASLSDFLNTQIPLNNSGAMGYDSQSLRARSTTTPNTTTPSNGTGNSNIQNSTVPYTLSQNETARRAMDPQNYFYRLSTPSATKKKRDDSEPHSRGHETQPRASRTKTTEAKPRKGGARRYGLTINGAMAQPILPSSLSEMSILSGILPIVQAAPSSGEEMVQTHSASFSGDLAGQEEASLGEVNREDLMGLNYLEGSPSTTLESMERAAQMSAMPAQGPEIPGQAVVQMQMAGVPIQGSASPMQIFGLSTQTQGGPDQSESSPGQIIQLPEWPATQVQGPEVGTNSADGPSVVGTQAGGTPQPGPPGVPGGRPRVAVSPGTGLDPNQAEVLAKQIGAVLSMGNAEEPKGPGAPQGEGGKDGKEGIPIAIISSRPSGSSVQGKDGESSSSSSPMILIVGDDPGKTGKDRAREVSSLAKAIVEEQERMSKEQDKQTPPTEQPPEPQPQPRPPEQPEPQPQPRPPEQPEPQPQPRPPEQPEPQPQPRPPEQPTEPPRPPGQPPEPQPKPQTDTQQTKPSSETPDQKQPQKPDQQPAQPESQPQKPDQQPAQPEPQPQKPDQQPAQPEPQQDRKSRTTGGNPSPPTPADDGQVSVIITLTPGGTADTGTQEKGKGGGNRTVPSQDGGTKPPPPPAGGNKTAPPPPAGGNNTVPAQDGDGKIIPAQDGNNKPPPPAKPSGKETTTAKDGGNKTSQSKDEKGDNDNTTIKTQEDKGGDNKTSKTQDDKGGDNKTSKTKGDKDDKSAQTSDKDKKVLPGNSGDGDQAQDEKEEEDKKSKTGKGEKKIARTRSDKVKGRAARPHALCEKCGKGSMEPGLLGRWV